MDLVNPAEAFKGGNKCRFEEEEMEPGDIDTDYSWKENFNIS